ncbi:MAG: acyl-CoA dehydrogenase family protein [Proteobacteria bacterium]|nr:acyl-CoA dehydrogenase family protein [Pseudomonadota bacterium]
MDAYRSAWLDDELDLFRDAVRRFVQMEIVPHDARWREQHHVDRELWNKAGAVGLLCTDIPAEYGGAGGDVRHEAIVAEEMGRHGITSLGHAVHSIVAHYVLNYGTEAQKRDWLSRMATGELVGAIAMTEPGAGSDLQSIRTRAVREGDEYVISGSKTFISNGLHAGLVGVVVKTDLFFDDCRVPVSCLLGPAEGQGFVQMMRDLPYERVLLAIGGLGAMEYALKLTADYTRERKVFGKPLLELQNTRFKLAEVKTSVHVARVFVDDCILKLRAGKLDTVTASMAKYWVTDMQNKVMDECLQLFGGYGYTREYPISQLYVDSRVQRIYGGANEIMKEIIARSI